jgi:hypothetical protein
MHLFNESSEREKVFAGSVSFGEFFIGARAICVYCAYYVNSFVSRFDIFPFDCFSLVCDKGCAMARKQRKPSTNLTLHPGIKDKANDVMKVLSFDNMTAFVEQLIRDKYAEVIGLARPNFNSSMSNSERTEVEAEIKKPITPSGAKHAAQAGHTPRESAHPIRHQKGRKSKIP